MADRRTAPRPLLTVAVVTVVGSLRLPAGEVAITFHATAVGYPSGALPIPDMEMSLQGPDGGDEPQITESIGATTTRSSQWPLATHRS